MDGKKRGKAVILLVLVAALVFASAIVYAGWCLKTNPSDLYCSQGTQDDCCGTGVNCPEYSATMPAECNTVCCYIPGNTIDSCNYLYQSECDQQSGVSAASCDTIDNCTEGCCCYTDENNNNHSDTRVKGACTSPYGYNFNTSSSVSSDAAACSDYCVGWSSGPGQPGNSECNDGIDNDGDGLIDYGQDPGCSSLGDNSELDPNIQCDNGIDDDGDGAIDSADTCCQSYPSKEEDFCDIDACTSGEKVNLDECRCNNNYRCSKDQYCCSDGCKSTPCGAEECLTGEQRSCGQKQGNCELFEHCVNGQWDGNCQPIPTCGLPFEICNDGVDNNNNGFTDCNDVVCQDMKCSPDEQTCQQKGYWDPLHEYWKCCYSGQRNDCDGDGTPETCGSCNCKQLMSAPYMKSAVINQGDDFITVDWGLNCNVDMYLYRCVKGDTNCEDYSDFSLISQTLNTWSFEDHDVQPQSSYCYYVQAQYPQGTKNSDITCVSSGDAVCMQMSTKEFCLNDTGGLSGKMTHRAWCSDGKLTTSACGSDEICMGPYEPDETTQCVYQSDCDECGEPLDMFADFATAMATYKDPGGYESDTLCQLIPTCYFDYSDTTVDKFSDCSGINNCYGYRSESACEGQPWESQANNKCLPRNCVWQPDATSTDIDQGICFETVAKYKKCEYCNDAANNKIFDSCTADRCMQFGDCYIRRIDDQCVDASKITCQDYRTETECTNGQDVNVNVVYDSKMIRVYGNYDNSILTRSNDAIGIGLCKWNDNFDPGCFKDADDDGQPDVYPYDKTPPFSRVITPSKVLAMNFTLQMSDVNPDGSQGTGARYTYLCLDDSGYCYPTKRYVPKNNTVNEEFGAGNGKHMIYYYSEDRAHNLEVVKNFTVDVDRSPPKISIEAYPAYDFKNYQNTNVTFYISLDEDATCTDSFEGASASKISYEYGSTFTPTYYGLTDGTYRYKVNCTDDVGNTAVKYYDLIIDIDSAVMNPRPTGVIDYTPVVLSIDTQTNVRCTYGPDNTFFDAPVQKSGYWEQTANYDLTASGTYSFDVKCDLGIRISTDEIQFVYDIDPPLTKVLDMYGKDFDFTKWYSGIDDKIFLGCTDSPEDGFGCNRTYYCVSGSKCTPNNLNNPADPIEYNLSASTKTWLCYYSVENTKGGFGGKVEDTKCKEIAVDHYDPILYINDIGHYSTPDNYYVTYSNSYRLTGYVDDPDAPSSPNNLVSITVTNAAGDSTYYYNIPANKDFSQLINLSDGLNEVDISAVDRSGASGELSFKTVFIYVAPYTGAKITLVSPKFGVAKTRVMNFTVQTYKDAECRFAIDSRYSFASSLPMVKDIEPDGEGYDYFHTGVDFDLGDLSEVKNPVYIKCKDPLGQIFTAAFNLSWDDTKPVIDEIWLSNSDGKDPPTLVEYPLETDILVKTKNDEVRCKYALVDGNAHDYYSSMKKFDGFDNQSLMQVNRQFFGPDLLDPSSTTYSFQCENGGGLVSDKKQFTLNVDTSKATGFSFLSPPKKSSNTSVTFRIQTTKTTFDCMYGQTDPPVNPMTRIDNKTHESEMITLPEGRYKYYFICKVANGQISDYYQFTIDSSPPTVPVIDDGIQTEYQTKLSAKWESTDNLSSVTEFNYSIGTKPGLADVYGWKETSSDKATVTGLNLTNGSTYYWNVKAMNNLGLWSKAGKSDGVLVNVSKYKGVIELENTTIPSPFNTCYNGVKDGNETDVDCGGDCGPCSEENSGCLVNSDCLSSYCVDGKCMEASCTDGVQNGHESDVDCGDTCSPCLLGKKCFYDSDCASGYCDPTGLCTEPSCYDGVRNGDETGIDCGGSCPDACTTSYQQNNYTSNNNNNSSTSEKSGFGFWTWLLIIICLIIIIAGGAYLGYVEYEKKKKGLGMPEPGIGGIPGKAMPRSGMGPPGPGKAPRPKPKTPEEKYLDSLSAMMRSKRQAQKEKDRKSVISKFDEGKKEDDPLFKAGEGKKALDKIISASEEREKEKSGSKILKPAEKSGSAPKQSKAGAKIEPPKPPEGTVQAKKAASKPTDKPKSGEAVVQVDEKDALEELSKIAKKSRSKNPLKDLSKIAGKQKPGKGPVKKTAKKKQPAKKSTGAKKKTPKKAPKNATTKKK